MIPEQQVETWAHQGSITQSSTTYSTIKTALEASSAPYAASDYKIFLQGSYGNDTNIYSDSDVDIVIVLEDTFHRDISKLPEDQKAAYLAAHSKADYPFADFKRDVLGVLAKKYGQRVSAGDKAISMVSGKSSSAAP